MQRFDVVIIGAGAIGVATARALALQKRWGKIAVVEKERACAVHTSGRNSGVIHAGFNAKPGSLKARFCVEGNRRLREFCRQRELPMLEVGTVVVALTEADDTVLDQLLERGKSNGVDGIKRMGRDELKNVEPHANGRSALVAPTGSITSGRAVVEALATEAKAQGVSFYFGSAANRPRQTSDGFEVDVGGETIGARWLVNCAGLHADRIAHSLGVARDYRIVPFRGEYYRLRAEKTGLLRSMLYPAPDLAFPFLGVHWTRTVDGQVLIGPNATLAWSRESYSPFSFRPDEAVGLFTDKRVWRMFSQSDVRRVVWDQFWISLSRSRFVSEARKLISEVRDEDFERGKSGNRAQLVDGAGRLVDDMMVVREGNALHVLNAVSPGFTCSLPFADHLVSLLGS